uniref:Uncharacterized protein n=1 Tax=Rhizophora mucronata TaxID=61149 RepID=A0A2P2QJ23_RHIMU
MCINNWFIFSNFSLIFF